MLKVLESDFARIPSLLDGEVAGPLPPAALVAPAPEPLVMAEPIQLGLF